MDDLFNEHQQTLANIDDENPIVVVDANLTGDEGEGENEEGPQKKRKTEHPIWEYFNVKEKDGIYCKAPNCKIKLALPIGLNDKRRIFSLFVVCLSVCRLSLVIWIGPCPRCLSLSEGQIFLNFCLSCQGQIFCLSQSVSVLSCLCPVSKSGTEERDRTDAFSGETDLPTVPVPSIGTEDRTGQDRTDRKKPGQENTGCVQFETNMELHSLSFTEPNKKFNYSFGNFFLLLFISMMFAE
jgi:hypothetical protein